jgi:hypothetical protein
MAKVPLYRVVKANGELQGPAFCKHCAEGYLRQWKGKHIGLVRAAGYCAECQVEEIQVARYDAYCGGF